MIRAKILSHLVVYAILCTTLIFIGFQINEVNETLYPKIISVGLVYYSAGAIFLIKKGIEPLATHLILDGKIDIVWGTKLCYWTLWWPHFWRKTH